MSRWKRLRRLVRSRWVRVALTVVAGLLLLGIVLDHALDEPLRRLVERNLNRSLIGYTAYVGALDFHLLGLSMDLADTVVTQDAHPDPPVLIVPGLRMSVHWQDLLRARLVADATFQDPTVHVNLVQIREESHDPVPFRGRGWQHALESIYPLKVNELRVHGGSLVYQDDSDFRPLHATQVELLAQNVRNIRSAQRQYPSSVHAEGVIFDVGRVSVDGHADFLAEPRPGVAGDITLENMELSYFEPIVRRFGATVHQGFLSGNGAFEVGPDIQALDLESVVVDDASIDYYRGGPPTPQARKVARRISETARAAMNDPQALFRIHSLLVRNGTLGIVNPRGDPPYRVYFSDADFELANLSSSAEDGPAHARLRGSFMGSGMVRASATFYPEGKGANFAAKLQIDDTQLKSMNQLLRARGNFDVTEGTFSLYTEIRVKDGHIEGYVKPLFRDIKVLDHEQDKHESVFHKMYEGLVGGVAKLLENRRGDVATVASLSGPVDDPTASTSQIIGGLLRNAFVHSILPGFQHEIARLNPLQYHRYKKRERKKEREKERITS